MKILHVDEQTGWRGGEQQASYLIAGSAQRGHDCFLAGRPGSPFSTTAHGGHVLGRLELSLRNEFDLVSAAKMAAFARTNGIQILHAHTGHAHMIACLARTFHRALKVVVSRRVDFPPAANIFSRYKYSLPDHFVAISDKIGQVLLKFGVSPAKVSVVHSGIDVSRLNVETESRTELGLPDGPLIGNVAALVGHKDHRTLIAAMPTVLKSIADAHLAIVGDGPLRRELEAQIAALDLGSHVHILGYRDDVPAILKAFDVFAMSSAEEGLGTSILDAMASGVPVAATDAGGIPEIVRHEETGLLSPKGDSVALGSALVRLLTDSALAARLVQNGQSMVDSEFSADSMVEGNLAVYEHVMNTKR